MKFTHHYGWGLHIKQTAHIINQTHRLAYDRLGADNRMTNVKTSTA